MKIISQVFTSRFITLYFGAILFGCLLNSTNLWAQKSKPTDPQASPHLKVYDLAIKYGDPNIALNALYYQLAQEPNNIALKDSISSLYLQLGAYRQSILVGQEIIATEPNNRKILELLSIAYESIGGIREALDYTEKLYKLTGSALQLYKIATQQFTLQRYGECNASIDALMQHPQISSEKVTISIPRTGQGAQEMRQEISLKAAAHNIRGAVYSDQKELELAKKAFAEAVQIEPNFVLAKNNLAEVEKKLNEKK